MITAARLTDTPFTLVDAPTDPRIPLVIGVTGHRQIAVEALPVVRERVRELLRELRSTYPDTPWLVLSPLAEGADRLVAAVAREEFQAGDQLLVPLPMPLEVYAADFDEADSLAEFHRLVAGATVLVMPETKDGAGLVLPETKDGAGCVLPETMGQPSSSHPWREARYAALGAFIARHSQILLALWDGKDTDTNCGTARVVQFKREGVPVEYRPTAEALDLVENGPVFHILTPRPGDECTSEQAPKPYRILPPATWTDHSPNDGQWDDLLDALRGHRQESPLKRNNHWHWRLLRMVEYGERLGRCCMRREQVHDDDPLARYHQMLTCIDRFNSGLRLTERLPDAIEQSVSDLIGSAESADGKVHHSLLYADTATVLQRYAVADVLARTRQRQQRNSLLTLFLLAVGAGGAFEFYAHLARHPLVLLLYPLFLLIALMLYRHAKGKQLQQQYLDYRALAEGMRVQFFWRLAGISESAAEHYLHQQRGELNWIRFAIRAWDLDLLSRSSSVPSAAHYEMIRQCWVFDQARYFGKSARLRQDYRKLFELGMLAFFLCGVLLALGAGLWGVFSHPMPQGEDSVHHRWLVVLMGFTPAIAAAFAGYAEKIAIAAEARQFARMVDIFMLAARQLTLLMQHAEYDRARQVLIEIGKEALEENGQWVMLHRERPLEVPIG